MPPSLFDDSKKVGGFKILDLSAGGRAIWYPGEKECDLTTYLDKRESMDPDIVCDSRELPEEWTNTYDLIVWDPPHLNCGPSSNMSKYYGHWTTKEILDTIEGTAPEAHRVAKQNALMAFKWNDHDIRLDRVVELMSNYWRPLFGHHLKNRGGSGAKSQSFWVMLLRRDV